MSGEGRSRVNPYKHQFAGNRLKMILRSPHLFLRPAALAWLQPAQWRHGHVPWPTKTHSHAGDSKTGEPQSITRRTSADT